MSVTFDRRLRLRLPAHRFVKLGVAPQLPGTAQLHVRRSFPFYYSVEYKQLDSMEDKLDMMNKCQKIAAAIMRGDRVPPEDLRYLMEHDKEGYKLAMAFCPGVLFLLLSRPSAPPFPRRWRTVRSAMGKSGRGWGGWGQM